MSHWKLICPNSFQSECHKKSAKKDFSKVSKLKFIENEIKIFQFLKQQRLNLIFTVMFLWSPSLADLLIVVICVLDFSFLSYQFFCLIVIVKIWAQEPQNPIYHKDLSNIFCFFCIIILSTWIKNKSQFPFI